MASSRATGGRPLRRAASPAPILLLIEGEGLRTATGYKIPTRYTHQQLGSMIGANREAVTRAFVRLREVGAVETRRRYIHVEDIEALRRAAEETSLQDS
jgi:CRP/FNR family transcriptional regulator